MKYQDMPLETIVEIFVKEIKHNPYVDYAQAYRDGVILVDGVGPKITRNDAMQNMQNQPGSYTELMLRFYDAQDGNIENAAEFRDNLIFVSRLFNQKFYSPKNALELQMSLSKIAKFQNAEIQRDLLRAMYNLARAAQATEMMIQIATALVGNKQATVDDMNKLIAVTDDRDALQKLVKRQITMADRAIHDEMNRKQPAPQKVKDIIASMNYGLDMASEKAPELGMLKSMAGDVYRLDNVMGGTIPEQDGADLESQLQAALAENAQLKQQMNQMMADAKESEHIIVDKNRELLETRKRMEEMESKMIKLIQDKQTMDTKMASLAQGAAKLKVGIGSRGVKKMKEMLDRAKDAKTK